MQNDCIDQDKDAEEVVSVSRSPRVEGMTLRGRKGVVSLTRREVQVVSWLLHGKPLAAVALALSISSRTVQNHFHRVKSKLSCKNKSDVVNWALESLFYRRLGASE